MKALQQRIVQIPRNPRPLVHPFFQAQIELVGEVIQTIAVNEPHRKKNQNHTGDSEPRGLPEERFDFEWEGSFGAILQAVAITCENAKTIVTCTQVGVGG